MSQLNPQDILHLGRLARLDLTAEEQERFAGQLSSVVQYVDQLTTVDTSSIKEVQGVSGQKNILAEDQPRSEKDPLSIPREKLLAGAPRTKNNLFQVRAVLDEGSAS